MASERLNPDLCGLSLADLQRRTSVKWSTYPEGVLPAWIAEMDFPLAPPVRDALAAAVEDGDTGYAAPEALGLGEAFAGFAERRVGWRVDPSRVHASSDVVGAIRAVLRALTRPGDKIVITPPVYHPFFALIPELGCEVAEAPLRAGQLDLEAIEQRFAEGAAALILCSPHNPAGTVPSAEQLAAVAAAAERHGAWELADEIHAPLTLPAAAHVPYLTVSEAAAERGVAFWSASKAFNVAGLGCAQIVTASRGANELIERLPRSATHCGQLGAIATVAAYRHGDPWLDDVIAVLDHNRRLLSELLAERLPEVGYEPPEAGYLAWLDFRALGKGEDPAAELLQRGEVALSSGPTFGVQGRGFARLNFGTSPALLEEIVARIAGAL